MTIWVISRVFQAQIGRPEGHVLTHGGHEQLVVRVREHQSHPASDLHQVVIGEFQLAEADCTPIGTEETVDMQRQCRLTCPVGAEYRQSLPRPHRECQPIESLSPVRIGEVEIRDLEGEAAHVTTRAITATATTGSSTRPATSHTPVEAGEPATRGMTPVYPRASIAPWIRSPRS
jgi:hypothetical protein